jgi:MFS family permease
MSIVDTVRREAQELWGGGKAKMLVPIAVGWGLIIGVRVIYPVLLPYLRRSFGLTLSIAGLLVTILWFSSAVGQLPSGGLADRYSERALMTTSPLVIALGLVIVTTAGLPIVLFLATAVVGLGLSLYPIARITILADIYPDRIGSALGVTMATGDLGQTVLPPVAGLIAVTTVWQAGLGFMIPLLVLVTLVLWVSLPERSTTESAVDEFSTESIEYLSVVLRQPSIVFMTFMLFLYIFIWQSFSAFYPTYLVEVKDLSSTVASGLFGLFFAFGIAVKPLAGAAYDRIGMRRSLIVALVGPVAGLVALPTVERFWLLAVVTALVSTMLGTGAITQSYLSDVFPEDMRGTGLGAVRTSAATLGATGPALFGVIADRGYFDEGYLGLAVIMIFIILLTFRMPQKDEP